jgi:hypothetical protein
MADYKSLVVKSEWKIAGRQRKCYHSAKHSISKGDAVLEVFANPGVHGYCLLCGHAMITAALDRLNKMQLHKVQPPPSTGV